MPSYPHDRRPPPRRRRGDRPSQGHDRGRERRSPGPSSAPFRLFAPTAAGLEEVLAEELRSIGAEGIRVAHRGVGFVGDLGTIYRANLWLRTAHRVLVELARFPARDRQELYEGVRRVFWADHVRVDGTLAVDAVCNRSQLSHSQFVSRVVKDGIVDGFMERMGRRPSVDPTSPDLQVNARLLQDECTLSLDTSGDRLHRRGYRPSRGAEAPLKETLAAGILLLAGYRGTEPLVDPMCGSGTFLVEAALLARNIAPGLLGRRFGLMRHPSFDRELWLYVLDEARRSVLEDRAPDLSGTDTSGAALAAAREAVTNAGVEDFVRLRRADVSQARCPEGGRVVVNPPYGERLGEVEALAPVYQRLGDTLKQRCKGATAHVFTGSRELSGHIGLKTARRDVLFNGPIECRLLTYELY